MKRRVYWERGHHQAARRSCCCKKAVERLLTGWREWEGVWVAFSGRTLAPRPQCQYFLRPRRGGPRSTANFGKGQVRSTPVTSCVNVDQKKANTKKGGILSSTLLCSSSQPEKHKSVSSCVCVSFCFPFLFFPCLVVYVGAPYQASFLK